VSIPIKIPEDNIHGLHALLALLQVKANDDVPLYWYRAEHIEDYKSLVAEPHPAACPHGFGAAGRTLRRPHRRRTENQPLRLCT